ncbi:MAG: hypothetical protein NW226_20270 [Microscillaceae bacterium]|nr:hypothetical protein [Microscillaceae bacterium]
MKKIFIYNLLFIGLVLGLSSCFDDPGTDILFEGVFVELDLATRAPSSGERIRIYARKDDGVNITDTIIINLVGAQRSTPVNVTIAVDAAGTTAVAGTHYNLSTTSVTIPANSSFGYIPFEVIDDNIDPNTPVTLSISIASSDVEISENYKSGTMTLRAQCGFDVNNFVGAYSAIEPGYSGSPYAVNFAKGTADNTIVIDNFWDFGGATVYTLNPANGTVTIVQQTVTMGGEGWIVAGSGTYDPCSGDMVVNYTVDRVADGQRYDDNTHTFTKQ